MSKTKRSRPLTLLACVAMAMAACTGDGPGGERGSDNAADADALPAPESSGGPVTGMPDALPASGPRPVPEAPTPDIAIDAPPLLDGDTPDGNDTPVAPDDDGPGADAAVQLVRDYYGAINRREYARAYALWSGQGQASGKSPAQFEEGFLDTSGVSVQIGRPEAVGAGAGQRHIEVPVTVLARHVDGSEQRFRGHYVLHRAVVDGASAEQRAWRIQSASLATAP